MKLQDFLHYYIGCKIEKYPDALDYPTIKGIEGDRVMVSQYQFKTPHADGIFTRPEMYQYVGFVRPILRRLSDVSTGEAIAIASMAMFDKLPGYPISDYTVRKESIGPYPPSACRVAINNDWYDMEIAIGFNTGNIWYTKGEHRVFNQPIIFHTLLQSQFDLFGLIDAGLAIDAKTLTL
jgi:hypothetical protein